MPALLYRIARKDLFDLFDRLSQDYKVFVPYSKRPPRAQSLGKSERLYFAEFNSEKQNSIELSAIRQSEPFKSFINLPRQRVLNKTEIEPKPIIVAGVKACDLKSLRLQDSVFRQGDFEDPAYVEHRDGVTIISCDCTKAEESCFCLAMDGESYPRELFDLNLSAVDDGFLVEVGSEKGKTIIDKYKMFFKDALPRDNQMRDTNRKRVSTEVQSFIDKRQTPAAERVIGTVKKNWSSRIWQDFSSTCVE